MCIWPWTTINRLKQEKTGLVQANLELTSTLREAVDTLHQAKDDVSSLLTLIKSGHFHDPKTQRFGKRGVIPAGLRHLLPK